MKAPFSIALLALVCCMPVFAHGTESSPAQDSVAASRPVGPVADVSHTSATAKQPDDRAVQIFRFSIRTSDGSLTRRTILATVDTSEAEAEKIALEDVPGGTVEERL